MSIRVSSSTGLLVRDRAAAFARVEEIRASMVAEASSALDTAELALLLDEPDMAAGAIREADSLLLAASRFGRAA